MWVPLIFKTTEYAAGWLSWLEGFINTTIDSSTPISISFRFSSLIPFLLLAISPDSHFQILPYFRLLPPSGLLS